MLMTAAIKVVYARERAHDLWPEITPLLIAHKDEVAQYPDIALDPDVESYNRAEDAGILRCFTARAPSALVGYCVFFVSHNLHYRGSKQARMDVLYIDREHRGRSARGLIRYTEDALRHEGVQVDYHHLKLATPDTITWFKYLGYEPIEVIVAKRLDGGG